MSQGDQGLKTKKLVPVSRKTRFLSFLNKSEVLYGQTPKILAFFAFLANFSVTFMAKSARFVKSGLKKASLVALIRMLFRSLQCRCSNSLLEMVFNDYYLQRHIQPQIWLHVFTHCQGTMCENIHRSFRQKEEKLWHDGKAVIQKLSENQFLKCHGRSSSQKCLWKWLLLYHQYQKILLSILIYEVQCHIEWTENVFLGLWQSNIRVRTCISD